MRELSRSEKLLCEAIKNGVVSFDMLVIKTGLDVGDVSSSLMMLELDKIISCDSDSTYRLLR